MGPRTRAHIWWSIYVKCSSLRKLRDAHLPPIERALESMEFAWQILTEDENPGLFRLITYQNVEIGSLDEIVIPLLRRAYKLAPAWTITGLGDLDSGRLHRIHGSCTNPLVSNQPPALESLVFEVEPGRILPMNPDGGWPVVDGPPGLDIKLAPGKQLGASEIPGDSGAGG